MNYESDFYTNVCICDRIWEHQLVSETNKFTFVALLLFISSGDAAVQI